MARPLITLTTDFGLSDHYVGAMKGVILGICPNATLVDLSHQVAAYGIPEAAFLLAQAYGCFPKGTVHLVVVDPGVGTARRPILAQAAGQVFIAPDNGVLTMIWSREPRHKVRAITASRYFRDPVSRTFHGRDVFAPVAAHLAAGVPPARMGKLIKDYLRLNFERPVQTGKRIWTGAVLKIDHFGNVITNFRPDTVPGMSSRPWLLTLGPHQVTRLAQTYGECPPGDLFLIEGSSGYLEISVNQDSAARVIGCEPGAPVEIVTF
ncbi:MAG: S-adenosyl-l-methionine hydroxide adenosyltransferase family protein [Bryobacteraceae bacterium]